MSDDPRGRAAGVLGPGKLRQLDAAGLAVVDDTARAKAKRRVTALVHLCEDPMERRGRTTHQQAEFLDRLRDELREIGELLAYTEDQP